MPHGPTYDRERKLYADVVAHEDDEVHWGPGLFPVPHAARFCTAAAWQRCFVHFLRNALDHLPRKAGDNCLQELRWHNVRRDLAEARQNLAHWLAKWQAKHPKLCDRLEENIEGGRICIEARPRSRQAASFGDGEAVGPGSRT